MVLVFPASALFSKISLQRLEDFEFINQQGKKLRQSNLHAFLSNLRPDCPRDVSCVAGVRGFGRLGPKLPQCRKTCVSRSGVTTGNSHISQARSFWIIWQDSIMIMIISLNSCQFFFTKTIRSISLTIHLSKSPRNPEWNAARDSAENLHRLLISIWRWKPSRCKYRW